MVIKYATLTVIGVSRGGEHFEQEYKTEQCEDGSELTLSALFWWERELIKDAIEAPEIVCFSEFLSVVSESERIYLP